MAYCVTFLRPGLWRLPYWRTTKETFYFDLDMCRLPLRTFLAQNENKSLCIWKASTNLACKRINYSRVLKGFVSETQSGQQQTGLYEQKWEFLINAPIKLVLGLQMSARRTFRKATLTPFKANPTHTVRRQGHGRTFIDFLPRTQCMVSSGQTYHSTSSAIKFLWPNSDSKLSIFLRFLEQRQTAVIYRRNTVRGNVRPRRRSTPLSHTSRPAKASVSSFVILRHVR